MKARPYSMIPALASRTYVYVFSYDGDEDDYAADKVAFDLELAKHIPFSAGCAQNGIEVQGADLDISDVGGVQTIKLASTATLPAAVCKHPVILHNGVAIPYSDFTLPIVLLDGAITLVAASTTTYPDNGTHKVYYSDHLSGYLVSAEVGGVSLPIDINSFNAVGHEEPVYRVIKRGDADGTGSINVVNDLTAHMFFGETTPENDPGEELFKRIYGSEWTSGSAWDSRNAFRPPTKPFGVAVLQHSGKQYEGETLAGHVWAQLLCVYHCMLTDIGAPQNITNDATDPIQQSVDFQSRYPDRTDISVIRTIA